MDRVSGPGFVNPPAYAAAGGENGLVLWAEIVVGEAGRELPHARLTSGVMGRGPMWSLREWQDVLGGLAPPADDIAGGVNPPNAGISDVGGFIDEPPPPKCMFGREREGLWG